MMILAILLIALLQEVPALVEPFEWYPSLAIPAALLLLLILSLLSGALVRAAWSTREMEAGELRKRIEALAGRAGVPTPRIRVLEGRREAQGFITGWTRGTRHVFLTGRLIRSFRPEEVEGLLAHELGHGRRHHLIYSLLLMAAFFLMIYPLLKTAMGYLSWAALPLVLAFSLAYWRFLAGRIYRKFELEADRYAAGVVGPARYRKVLESCLGSEEVSRRGSWRHPGLEERIRAASSGEESDNSRSGLPGAGIRPRRAILALFFLSLALFVAVFAAEISRNH